MRLLWVLGLGFALVLGIQSNPLLRENQDVIGDVTKNIEDLLSFLCTRCQEIITQINHSIENETLIENVKDFCDRAIGNPALREFCGDVVKDVLVQVYKQLRKFQPHPALCSHLRLCDSCAIGPSSNESFSSKSRSLPILRDGEDDVSSVNPFVLYEKLHPLVQLFKADAHFRKGKTD